MTKAEILTAIYTSKEVDEVISKIRPDYLREDVKQHAFLILFEKDDQFIIDLHERQKIKQYVVKVIYNTINFSHNEFHSQLKRDKEVPMENINCVAEETDNEYEHLVQACQKGLEGVYWYNAELLKMYAELGNYRAVAEKTRIPLKSVYNAVEKAKEQIRRSLHEH